MITRQEGIKIKYWRERRGSDEQVHNTWEGSLGWARAGTEGTAVNSGPVHPNRRKKDRSVQIKVGMLICKYILKILADDSLIKDIKSEAKDKIGRHIMEWQF